MKIGSYDVPDIRLMPTTVTTLEEIYKIKKRARVPAKDLAILLGYKWGTEPHFYRKIHSLLEFGLIEGKGSYEVSEWGEKILHPRSDQEKALATTRAVLNVPLWKAIYEKHGKKPREDNFWAVLVDVTKVDPDTAKTSASKILRWYAEDIAHVSESSLPIQLEVVGEHTLTPTDETKTLSSKEGYTKPMSQQLASPDQEKLEFGGAVLLLPKKDIKKEWEKLQKYMIIYLEDYKEPITEENLQTE